MTEPYRTRTYRQRCGNRSRLERSKVITVEDVPKTRIDRRIYVGLGKLEFSGKGYNPMVGSYGGSGSNSNGASGQNDQNSKIIV